jgi:hypothetical protein
MFWCTVQGCWLPTPFASFPLTSPPMRHRVPSGSKRPIPTTSAIKAATHYRWNQELKFLCIKKQKLNKRLYKIRVECAATWNNKWQLIHSSIDAKLQWQIEHNMIMPKENWTVSNLNNNSAFQIFKTTKNVNDHNFTLEYKIKQKLNSQKKKWNS